MHLRIMCYLLMRRLLNQLMIDVDVYVQLVLYHHLLLVNLHMLMMKRCMVCIFLSTYSAQTYKSLSCPSLSYTSSYQRKGLATMLLRHVLDLADGEGRKVYIEATDAGWPVYHKVAFRDVDIVQVNMMKYGGEGWGRNRCMMREPVLREEAQS